MNEMITAQDEQTVLYALDMEVMGKTFSELKQDTNMETAKLVAILEALQRKDSVGYDGNRYFIKSKNT